MFRNIPKCELCRITHTKSIFLICHKCRKNRFITERQIYRKYGITKEQLDKCDLTVYHFCNEKSYMPHQIVQLI